MVLDKSNEKKPEHAKIISIIRNNGESVQVDQTNNGAKAKKDSVIVVGDLMIKHVTGCHSCSHREKVYPNPWASTQDLIDYGKHVIRKKTEFPGDSYRY